MNKSVSSPINGFHTSKAKHDQLIGDLSLQEQSIVKQIIELFQKAKCNEDQMSMVSIQEKIVMEYQRAEEDLDNSATLEGCLKFTIQQYHQKEQQIQRLFLIFTKMEEAVMELLDRHSHLSQKCLEMEEIVEAEAKEVQSLTLKNEKLYEELNYVLKRQQNSEEKYEQQRNFKMDEINDIVKQLSQKQQENGNKLISSIRFLEKQLSNNEERRVELEEENSYLKLRQKQRQAETSALLQENRRILSEFNKQKQWHQQSVPNSKQLVLESTQKKDSSQQPSSYCKDSISDKAKQQKYPSTKNDYESFNYRNSFPKVKKILSFGKGMEGVKPDENRKSNDYSSNVLNNQATFSKSNQNFGFDKKSPQSSSLYRINSLSSLCSTSSKPKLRETLKQNLEQSPDVGSKKGIGLMKELKEQSEAESKHLSNKISFNAQSFSHEPKGLPLKDIQNNKNDTIRSIIHLHPSTSTNCEIPIQQIKRPQRSTNVKSAHEIEGKEIGVGSSIHGFVSGLVTMRTHKRKNQKNVEEQNKKQDNVARNRLSKSFANPIHNTAKKLTQNQGQDKITLMYKNASVRKDLRKNQTVGQVFSNHKENKTYQDSTIELLKNTSSGIFTGIFDIVTRRAKK